MPFNYQAEIPSPYVPPAPPLSSARRASSALPIQAPEVKSMYNEDEFYMNKMRNALAEMDMQHKFVPGGCFLDLGCCPGGFSAHVLSKWPSARGVGISLPVEHGGHSLAVPTKLRDRLEVHWADVTMFNLAPHLLHEQWDTSILTPHPIQPRSFDFVMADGHEHPAMPTGNPRAVWNKDRLLLSQLLLALQAIKPGGTLLAKFTLQHSVLLTRRIIVALSRLSSTPVKSIKPTSIYADKKTFYILVQAVNAEKCSELVRTLEDFWCFMTFGGPKEVGRGLVESDLEAIAKSSEVQGEKQRLKALFDLVEIVRKSPAAQKKKSRRK
ncbi:hypothetical protein BDV93DRAFT_611152 [Ceratobasidium sp. AG-I]|nr:hypothetical protein BDV93DRAFT_611152 [Ceratobasidium sp. AG-I]